MKSRTFHALLSFGSLVCLAGVAHATSESLFGFGPRNIGLAQSDVADAHPTAAPYVNPSLAWQPGVRVALGYGHGWTRLKLDGANFGGRDIAGAQVALQIGAALDGDWGLGGGLALHLPNRSLARIEFVPGTEPNFVRFEPAGHRTTLDAGFAARWKFLSLGVGASAIVSAKGQVDFLLAQDGGGTYADGEANVSLPYKVAPLLGLALDLGAAGLGLRYRGSQSVELDLKTQAIVEVQGNPLNGISRVDVSGFSGYVPATFDLAARWSLLKSIRVMSSLQWARWGAAPSPVADLTMAVDLGLSPGQRESRFVRPAYRDTLSPRVGIEMIPAPSWVVRTGYAFTPSPVPDPVGFASPADASTHTFALGTGMDFGRVWGVDLRWDGAGQFVSLKTREFDKRSDTLPFSRYKASGYVILGNIALEGAW